MMKRKVLVVVDMQNDFVTGALRNEEAIKIVPNVVKKIDQALKDDNVNLVFTKDLHEDEDYLNTEEGKNLPVKHCINGTEGQDIIPEIKALLYDKKCRCTIFHKNTFGCVGLGNSLKTINENENTDPITEVELIGVCTDICVISNALLIKAFIPNVHIVVDASCCAGVTPESHKNALKAMKACQIEIINEDLS